jgi:hypothetical protein
MATKRRFQDISNTFTVEKGQVRSPKVISPGKRPRCAEVFVEVPPVKDRGRFSAANLKEAEEIKENETENEDIENAVRFVGCSG